MVINNKMAKKLLVANWKMNPDTVDSADHLFDAVLKGINEDLNAEVVICPPFIYLERLKSKNKKLKKNVNLGAQDCFWEEKGAFTGEISPTMLKNIRCHYVILGHSERRDFFAETDEMILQKTKKALQVGLKPILCIGEKGEEKESGETFDVLKNQIQNVVGKLPKYQLANLSIAYEPIWAIGTGENCPANEAMTVLMFIKKELLKILSKNIVDRIMILYGGSVNSKNAKCYIDAGFDGLLVGGASLKPGDFVEMIKTCSN